MSDSYLPSRSSALVSGAPEPPPPPLFWIRRAERRDSIRLVLGGELDLAARPRLAAALADAQTDSARVVLDLGALTLIDCASLFVIFAAAARAHREKSTLILLGPRGQVRRVLDLVGAPAGVVVMDHDDLPTDADGEVVAS